MADTVVRPRFDVHNPRSRAGQVFVKYARKVYNPIGFKKGYNFPLFIVGFGGLLGFCLSRAFYLNFYGVAAKEFIPGEMFWYKTGFRRVGIQMHLIGAIIGGILASFQFIPIIRYKLMLFHRLNGYAAIIFFLAGNAGAFMIIRHAAGGTTASQTWMGVMGVLTTSGLILAYVNIKRLQIDQHRAWMIRTWSIAACIASQRLIMKAMIYVITVYTYDYWQTIPCREIFFIYKSFGVPDQGNPVAQIYPTCAANGANPATNTAQAAVPCIGTGPENSTAILRLCFGAAGWVAMAIHILCAELYLWLTPAESYRLRTVSRQRQIEAGIVGQLDRTDAGTTAKTMGDAPEWWSTPIDEYKKGRAPGDKTLYQPVAGEDSDETK